MVSPAQTVLTQSARALTDLATMREQIARATEIEAVASTLQGDIEALTNRVSIFAQEIVDYDEMGIQFVKNIERLKTEIPEIEGTLQTKIAQSLFNRVEAFFASSSSSDPDLAKVKGFRDEHTALKIDKSFPAKRLFNNINRLLPAAPAKRSSPSFAPVRPPSPTIPQTTEQLISSESETRFQHLVAHSGLNFGTESSSMRIPTPFRTTRSTSSVGSPPSGDALIFASVGRPRSDSPARPPGQRNSPPRDDDTLLKQSSWGTRPTKDSGASAAPASVSGSQAATSTATHRRQDSASSSSYRTATNISLKFEGRKTSFKASLLATTMSFIESVCGSSSPINLQAILKTGDDIAHTQITTSSGTVDKLNGPSEAQVLASSKLMRIPLSSPWNVELIPGSEKQLYEQLIQTLDKHRLSKNGQKAPSIGVMIQTIRATLALTISSNRSVIDLFCFDELEGQATHMAFYSSADVVKYLAEHCSVLCRTTLSINPLMTKSNYAKFASTEAASASASSTSSASAASTAAAAASIRKDSTLLLDIARMKTIQDNHSKVSIEETVSELRKLRERMLFPISGIEMGLGGLVYNHLYAIQRAQKHSGMKISPQYTLNAFQNIEGCTSTPEQRNLAFERAKIDTILAGMKQELQSDKLPNVGYFVHLDAIDGASKQFYAEYAKAAFNTGAGDIDTLSELGKGAVHESPSVEHLSTAIQNLEAILKKEWGFQ